jgi:hypothetical protein
VVAKAISKYCGIQGFLTTMASREEYAAHVHTAILLTGATGYIGGRLLKELEHTAYPLRCLARRPQFLRAKWPLPLRLSAATCSTVTASTRPCTASIRPITWSTYGLDHGV